MAKKNVSAVARCAGSTGQRRMTRMTNQQSESDKPIRRLEKPIQQLAMSSPGEFELDLVSGSDYSSLEQAQTALLATLPDLIVATVRRGLEVGAFQIIGNRVVICDKIGSSPLSIVQIVNSQVEKSPYSLVGRTSAKRG